MKSTKVLQKLAKNPFYKMTPEEQEQLQNGSESFPKAKVSSKGNAAVKSVGKLNKHETDPVAE